MRKFVYADTKNCTGCRICEISCSMRFFKVVNPRKSRVRVIREEPVIDLPILCKHCADPPCLRACPENAINKSKSGQVVVKISKCTGCAACVEACPFGAMTLRPDTGKAMNCIVCGECVKNCPTQCLHIFTVDSLGSFKRNAFLDKRRKDILASIGITTEKTQTE